MNRRTIPALLASLAQAFLAPWLANAGTIPAAPLPATQLCRGAIDAAERAHGIPAHLLAAIARVESGRRDPASGSLNPWPWTINFDGQGSFYDAKAQAVAAAQSMRPRVARSIDVGCMQVSLTQHPDAFATLDEAFDPVANANYGARFLLTLYERTMSWPKAVAAYHSATPDLGSAYQAHVYAAWPEEQKQAAAIPPVPFISPLAPGWNRSPFPAAMAQAVPRVIPLAATGSPAAPGRTLDSYRATPVRMAFGTRWWHGQHSQ
jgi:hypothetical protein